MLKLISWNVNGLRACYDKGFTDIFRQLDADFFCLQETKMQAGQLDLQFDGYRSYWNYAEKKGYSGTAVFTRLQPISVSYGMDRTEHDREGRIITLEMEDFFLVNVYTPNSQEGLKRLEYRMTWEDDFLHFLKQLETQKPIIVCGDLNVAHQEIDLKIPKQTEKTPDLPMKSAINSPNYCLPDSPIHSAIFILIKRDLFVVVLPIQSERKKRRLAYRLFSCLRIAQREIVQCENTHGNFRLGPLSRRAGS